MDLLFEEKETAASNLKFEVDGLRVFQLALSYELLPYRESNCAILRLSLIELIDVDLSSW